MLRSLSWVSFAGLVLSNCAHPGPEVQVCVVDFKSQGFQCYRDPNINTFLAWNEGKDLHCIPPQEVELALKACKQGQALPTTLCDLAPDLLSFYCTKVDGSHYYLMLDASDNYACVNEQDRQRLFQRCKSGKSI